jgi:adenosylhomocysteinase
LRKKLGEEVPACMVLGFGGTITKLNKALVDYIGVDSAGPFKPDSYKY